jgi:hypothetical protein
MKKTLLALVALSAALAVLGGGCTGRVVKTITVESEPQGALVWLNDREVGRTPVTMPFTWYGVYRIHLELPGYEPMTDFERVAAPWYEWIGLDLAFETVVPGTRRDEHHFPPYILVPAKSATAAEVLERGDTFRTEAEQGLETKK